jgi:hypothetical protein
MQVTYTFEVNNRGASKEDLLTVKERLEEALDSLSDKDGLDVEMHWRDIDDD